MTSDASVERTQLPSSECEAPRYPAKGRREVNRRVPVVSIDIPPPSSSSSSKFRENVFAPPRSVGARRIRRRGGPSASPRLRGLSISLFAESRRVVHYTRNNSETDSRGQVRPRSRGRIGRAGRKREKEGERGAEREIKTGESTKRMISHREAILAVLRRVIRPGFAVVFDRCSGSFSFSLGFLGSTHLSVLLAHDSDHTRIYRLIIHVPKWKAVSPGMSVLSLNVFAERKYN